MTFKGYLFKMNRNIVLGLCVLALQVQLASSGIPGLTGLFDGITQGLSTQAITKFFESHTKTLFDVKIYINLAMEISGQQYSLGEGHLSLPAIVILSAYCLIYKMSDRIGNCIGMAIAAFAFLVMAQLALANSDLLDTIFVNMLKAIERFTNPAFK